MKKTGKKKCGWGKVVRIDGETWRYRLSKRGLRIRRPDGGPSIKVPSEEFMEFCLSRHFYVDHRIYNYGSVTSKHIKRYIEVKYVYPEVAGLYALLKAQF